MSKRCTVDGCKKWRVPGKEQCRDHVTEVANSRKVSQHAHVNQFTSADVHKAGGLLHAAKVEKNTDVVNTDVVKAADGTRKDSTTEEAPAPRKKTAKREFSDSMYEDEP